MDLTVKSAFNWTIIFNAAEAETAFSAENLVDQLWLWVLWSYFSNIIFSVILAWQVAPNMNVDRLVVNSILCCCNYKQKSEA